VKSQDERTQTNNLCLQGRSTGIRGIHNNNLCIDYDILLRKSNHRHIISEEKHQIVKYV
jgi:hypothetical protein